MAVKLTETLISQVQVVLDMAKDKTAMQDKASTFAGVSTGTDLVFNNGTGGSGTSGAVTTIDTATGVITIGRAGSMKLSVDGSFHASGATDFSLQIHLDTGGGYSDTGFGLVRTISNNSDGSFSATFHGARSIGDKIKIVMVSSTSRDIMFNGVAVVTEWIS